MPGRIRTLRRQQEIGEVFETGRRYRGRLVSMVVRRRLGGEGGVLFVASRKVGTAVLRNRLRRRMREAYRSLLSCVVGAWDVVLIATPGAAEASYAELRDEVAQLFGRAGLLATGSGEEGC